MFTIFSRNEATQRAVLYCGFYYRVDTVFAARYAILRVSTAQFPLHNAIPNPVRSLRKAWLSERLDGCRLRLSAVHCA
jgi:hypothetical protein